MVVLHPNSVPGLSVVDVCPTFCRKLSSEMFNFLLVLLEVWHQAIPYVVFLLLLVIAVW